ncbi:MAG: type II secretion system ATPase GspE [Pseudomonadales bacterium]|nr:type II secretion system ATPase GspE [Pseudomonadales bacterium]
MSRQGQLAYSFAKRHGVLLVKQAETQELRLLLREDVKLSALMEVRRVLGSLTVEQSLAATEFNQRLAQSYQGDGGESQQAVDGLEDHPDLESLAESVPETEDLMEQEDDAPIIRLINALLSEAIRLSASDIHIEAFEKRLSVRMRVDGMLREIVQPRRELAPLLVSRIKVMAKLDIAEKRIPQDGRISLRLAGREVDVRVSTLPANHGERVVMRLLDKQAGRLDIGHLGLQATDHQRLRELIHKPHGIMLVTGPTGSGKTTTLYASLTELNDNSRNILTVEDPIEYQLEGIGQTQVNTKVDMTFARGLRAMLRQDPDVVMVGEIRDMETAEIAVQASLTGHLVLSTLHTNTAVGAVTRLQDMGIEPFLLASSLLGVVAQRLVRVLCVSCRQGFPADEGECNLLGVSHQYAPTIYRPVGCDKCNFSGYRGRIGIYELVVIDDTMRRLIHSHAGEHELEAHARTMSSSIRADGIRKVLKGVTTLEEVVRATREG